MRYRLFKAAFELLALTRVTGLVRRFSQSRGLILTLHRVLPQAPAEFAPNAILQVTPKFLEAAIVRARALGFDIVDLDEAITRLGRENARPFVVLTFDDAYRDNLEHALPILRKHEAPFTLYVPTALVDGNAQVWWQAIEDVIASNPAISVPEGDDFRSVVCDTVESKHRLYNQLYWKCRDIPEPERVRFVAELTAANHLDLAQHCRALIMDWPELETFVHEPLCTIGAHTVSHAELSNLSTDEVRFEMDTSRDVLTERTGRRPTHFSYPIGSHRAAGPREYEMARELGFASGVTTIPGGLYAHHANTPHALPRISLNGNFQQERYLDVLLTGALFTVMARLDKGPRA